jgi:hypothetical protein
LGLISAGGAFILWTYLALTTWNDPVQYEAARTAAMMGLLALGGTLVTLFDRPILMIVIFGFSFFPVGLYLLGVPSVYMLIGVFDLLYLLAALSLLYYRFQDRYKQ